MNAGRRQLPALTGVRFFLALWVVIYHQGAAVTALIGGGDWVRASASAFLRTGYAAVGVFFILSGFILAYNYDLDTLRTRNLWRFASARFSRIYPAYLAGLLLLVPLLVYRLSRGIGPGARVELSTLLLNLTLIQSWVPQAALTWNYPGWSLSNEAFFYALFPFLGAWLWSLTRKMKPGRISGLAILLWILALALPLYAVLHPVPFFGDAPATDMELNGAGWQAQFFRYNPVLRLPEFLLGVICARVFGQVTKVSSLRGRGYWLYVPGLCLAILTLGNAELIPYPLLHNGLLAPASALIIVGLALGGGVLERILSLRTFVFLGNASYSMYILHVPISTWLKLGFTRVLNIQPDGYVWILSYVVAVVGLSSVFFTTIEEPMHRFLKKWLSSLVSSPAPSRAIAQ